MKETLADFERWAADVIFGRARGFSALLLRWTLRALSWIFRGLIQLRVFLFRHDYAQRYHLGALTISVGNLTVGGTGKTPVVEFLAKTLQHQGRRVAILSRGYKSKALAKPQSWDSPLAARDLPKIVSAEGKIHLNSVFAGDEPYMLAKNLPDVAVLVDRDRVKSARFAVRALNCDTLLLDDGMQYLRMARGIDMVLVDANAPFGSGALLPAGTLREPRHHLRRAHIILITKSDGSDHEQLIAQLRRYNPRAPIVITTHGPQHLENLFTQERLPLASLQGKHVAALSAIAVPESFENSLSKLGATVQFTKRFSDHHRFSHRDIASFMRRCLERDVDMVVTTEKDAVRYPRNQPPLVPVWFLRIEVKILSGQEHWDHLIHYLCGSGGDSSPLLRHSLDHHL